MTNSLVLVLVLEGGVAQCNLTFYLTFSTCFASLKMEALDITIESTAPEYVEEYADSELSSVSSATPSPLPSAIRRQSGRPRVGICNFDIAGKFTTNMKQHVKSAHPMFYKTIVEKEKQSKAKQMHKSETASKIMFTKQLTLPESLKSHKEYDRNSDIYKFLLRKLAVFIGSTNTPNSLVENNEFRSLMCNQTRNQPTCSGCQRNH